MIPETDDPAILKAWFKGLTKDDKRAHGEAFNRRLAEIIAPKRTNRMLGIHDDPSSWIAANPSRVHYWHCLKEASGVARYAIHEIIDRETPGNRAELMETAATQPNLVLADGMLLRRHEIRIPN